MKGREHREFRYTNSDGDGGLIALSFGPWQSLRVDAPIMLTFEDAGWMGVEETEEFLRWLKVALAEAKRRHTPRKA